MEDDAEAKSVSERKRAHYKRRYKRDYQSPGVAEFYKADHEAHEGREPRHCDVVVSVPPEEDPKAMLVDCGHFPDSDLDEDLWAYPMGIEYVEAPGGMAAWSERENRAVSAWIWEASGPVRRR